MSAGINFTPVFGSVGGDYLVMYALLVHPTAIYVYDDSFVWECVMVNGLRDTFLEHVSARVRILSFVFVVEITTQRRFADGFVFSAVLETVHYRLQLSLSTMGLGIECPYKTLLPVAILHAGRPRPRHIVHVPIARLCRTTQLAHGHGRLQWRLNACIRVHRIQFGCRRWWPIDSDC
ncbi:unnamed protein product [Sphagnum balticum]